MGKGAGPKRLHKRCMCRVAGREKVVGGPKVPNGSSYCPAGESGAWLTTGAPTRERPLSPWTISATSMAFLLAHRGSLSC